MKKLIVFLACSVVSCSDISQCYNISDEDATKIAVRRIEGALMEGAPWVERTLSDEFRQTYKVSRIERVTVELQENISDTAVYFVAEGSEIEEAYVTIYQDCDTKIRVSAT